MFDALKKITSAGAGASSRAPADELKDLIAAAREERAALSAMLTQIEMRLAKVTQAGKAVEQMEQKVDATSARIEEARKALAEVDDDAGLMESRRRMVSEAQAQANLMSSMLDDVRGRMEELTEHRALINDVAEKLARLDFVLREAQSTTLELRHERELARRVEQATGQLRAASHVPQVGKPGA